MASMLDLPCSLKAILCIIRPIIAIYVSMLTMEWIKQNGGVKEMEKRNEAKAKLIYGEIDRNSMFKGATVAEVVHI